MNPHNEMLIVLVLFARNIPCFGLDPLLMWLAKSPLLDIHDISTDEFSFLAGKKNAEKRIWIFQVQI